MLTEPIHYRPKDHLRSDLRHSCVDGATYSAMVGLGETYFLALYLALGLGQTSISLLASLPILAGSLLQLVTPQGIALFGSLRRWIVVNATIQGLSLVLLAVVIATDMASMLIVFFVSTIYYASGQATAPAWNAWMEKLLPRTIRSRFLSRRLRICQLCLLAAVAIAGFVFHFVSSHEKVASGGLDLHSPLVPFACFLLVAGILRFVSAWSLSQQFERRQWAFQSPAESFERKQVAANFSTARESAAIQPYFLHVSQFVPSLLRYYRAGFVSLRQKSRTRLQIQVAKSKSQEYQPWRLLLFFIVVQFSVYISAAFFAPFQLKVLGFTYWQFSLLIMIAYAGKILALDFVGQIAKRIGSERLLLVGAIGIIPIAGLWAISQSFWYLVCVQILSGVVWAFFELATALAFIENVPVKDRLRLISRFNVGNSAALVAGALTGDWLFHWIGHDYGAFLWVFAASTVARLAALTMFPYRFPELSKLFPSFGFRPRPVIEMVGED